MHADSARDESGGGTRPGATWEPFGIPPEKTPWKGLFLPEHGGVKSASPLAAQAAPRGTERPVSDLAPVCDAGPRACSPRPRQLSSFAARSGRISVAKNIRSAAALEAGIPDAAALVFAALGIALALYGKRAIRARVLNVASVATSVSMNLLAAAPGSRNLAIWVMPPIAYALASGHCHRRDPGVDAGPEARAGAGPGRRRRHRWRSSAAWPCGACA